MNLFNQLVTAETVMWAAAAVSLVFLVLHKPVSAIWISTSRDSTTRLFKVLVYFISILLVAIPGLVLITGQTLKGTACGYYLLFSLLFWYYLGKNRGLAKGRRDLEELIGLDAYEGVADAQDRLHESRMRLKTNEEVVESMMRLARGEDGGEKAGRADYRRHNTSTILDVVVEETD